MRSTGILAIATIALLLGGCGLLNPSGSWDPFASAAERRVMVHVQNRHVEDVTVNVVAAGRRESLGRIDGRSQRQFSVSWPRTENIQFQIEPFAGRRHTVGGGVVRPGERLELYVQDPITRSFVSR